MNRRTLAYMLFAVVSGAVIAGLAHAQHDGRSSPVVSKAVPHVAAPAESDAPAVQPMPPQICPHCGRPWPKVGGPLQKLVPGQDFGQMMGAIQHIRTIVDDPVTAGILSVGALKDGRPADKAVADLESLLETVDSLAIRNAIRLSLKDLYQQQHNDQKLAEVLKALVLDNDQAAASRNWHGQPSWIEPGGVSPSSGIEPFMAPAPETIVFPPQGRPERP